LYQGKGICAIYNDEQKNYIIKISTKGGITEAIINALKDDLTLVEAFKAGINRSNEIVK
jgi:hypothetical protein